MGAAILPFRSAKTVDEAWERYCALVAERADQSLWTDLDHNKRIARAWDEWSTLFNASERER